MLISRKKYENMKRELEQQIRELTMRNGSALAEVAKYRADEKEREQGRVKGAWCEGCDNLISVHQYLCGNEVGDAALKHYIHPPVPQKIPVRNR